MACGAAGDLGWCNTCEVQGNRPLPGGRHRLLITPYCRMCIADNIICPICGVAPNDGPADADFLPPGWEEGSGIQFPGQP